MLCNIDEWLIGGCFYAFGLFDKWKTYYARLLGMLCPRTFRKLLSHRLLVINSDTFCTALQLHAMTDFFLHGKFKRRI
jgi:hypothetical protein